MNEITNALYTEIDLLKKSHEWVSAINKYEAWKDENRRLQIENRRLQLMNPCNHTGFESAPCDVCGYPDPRKLIAKLKEENQRLRAFWEWSRLADKMTFEQYHWKEASHE